MSEKPEALRLADELESMWKKDPVAKELRRLHADNERLKGLLREARDSVWSVNDFCLLERIDAALQEDKT